MTRFQVWEDFQAAAERLARESGGKVCCFLCVTWARSHSGPVQARCVSKYRNEEGELNVRITDDFQVRLVRQSACAGPDALPAVAAIYDTRAARHEESGAVYAALPADHHWHRALTRLYADVRQHAHTFAITVPAIAPLSSVPSIGDLARATFVQCRLHAAIPHVKKRRRRNTHLVQSQPSHHVTEPRGTHCCAPARSPWPCLQGRCKPSARPEVPRRVSGYAQGPLSSFAHLSCHSCAAA